MKHIRNPKSYSYEGSEVYCKNQPMSYYIWKQKANLHVSYQQKWLRQIAKLDTLKLF